MQSSIRRFTRWAGLAMASVLIAVSAVADLGIGLMAWASYKVADAGRWLVKVALHAIPMPAAKADQLHRQPSQRLCSSSQYQTRTVKRETPTLTERWRMCPSI